MFSLAFNRQRRRAEKELQEKKSEKLKRKPSVAFQPEGSLVNDNDSEMVMKPKVQKHHYRCLSGLHVHRVGNVFVVYLVF